MSISRKVSVLGTYPYNPKETPGQFTKRSFVTQQRAGVDYPSAQGARGDMFDQFFNDPHFYGIQAIEGRTGYMMFDIPEVTGPLGVDDIELMIRLAQEMGYNISGLSIPVTGPFTMASRVITPDHKPIFDNDEREELIEYFAAAVADIVERYDERFGGNIIRIDEPVADSGGLDRFQHAYIANRWDSILGRVKNNTPGIHICGSIKHIAPVLMMLQTPKDGEVLFSHDFTGLYGKNIGQLTASWVKDTGAMIGAGLVNSGSHIVELPMNPRFADYVNYEGQVEIPQDSRELYRRLYATYGIDKINLHPGCGFGLIMRQLNFNPKNLIHQYIVMNHIIGPKLRILKELADNP